VSGIGSGVGKCRVSSFTTHGHPAVGAFLVSAPEGIFGLIGGCMADTTFNWPLLFIQTNYQDAWWWCILADKY